MTDTQTQQTGGTIDLADIDRMVEAHGRSANAVLPILRAIQEHYRYLPEAALRRVVETTEIKAAAIMGVATFYSHFRLTPAGIHTIKVCVGTACHVKGAEQVRDAFCRHLGIAENGDTDPKGLFTVQRVACLGCCTLAPAVQINDVTYGHVTPGTVGDVIADFLKREAAERSAPAAARAGDGASQGEIRVGLGSCCVAGGSAEVRDALAVSLERHGINATVKRVGCVGMCHQTPLLEIVRAGEAPHLYARLKADDVDAIVVRHFRPDGWWRRVRAAAALWTDRLVLGPETPTVERHALNVRDPHVSAFLDPQKHIATEDSGALDPTELAEYRARRGFEALENVLRKMTPGDVIATIVKSGLRGRGGAGFPTGIKWTAVRDARGDRKVIVCNGDEGDPGAFMDRMLLESYPYRVLEGMLIGAYAVGAREGILYIRSEYPLALKRVTEALGIMEREGLLGDDILGTGFSLRLRIVEGAGAFVCGEETALIASIEGRRGMPHLRPPFPAQRGVFGLPTLVNNVETYAAVPWILTHGADAFARIGTGRSFGTKVFSLAGKISRGGLIEVPMGITIREIVETVGGGVAGGRRLKAVQIGGPSGGCLPATAGDIPIDYEALTAAGAMMGSGGLVVLDDTDCMVDMARYFLSFTQRESCGKCTFCRVGTKRMLEKLEKLCAGKGQPDDLDELENLALMIKRGSLCGLGKTAPNPVLTTLRYFRGEYEAHLRGECPAGKCKAMIRYTISADCIGCTRCAQVCPVEAITPRPHRRQHIQDHLCTRCDMCRTACPVGAIRIETGPVKEPT